MSLSSEYLDRIRQIRGKYGGGQIKLDLEPYSEKYAQNGNKQGYLKPELQNFEGKRYNEAFSVTGRLPSYSRPGGYVSRPRSQTENGSNTYCGMKNFERQKNREKQFDLIRKNYAQSRKKVIDDFSSKAYSRYQCKDGKEEHHPYISDCIRNYRDYSKSYTRTKEPEYKSMSIDVSKHLVGNLQNEGLFPGETISPIKQIIPGYEERRSYRERSGRENDLLYPEREVKLSAFTEGQLNESKTLTRSIKPESISVENSRRLRMCQGVGLKSYGDGQGVGSSILEMQNHSGQFSVSNIDRIQKRIKSILDRR